MNFFETEVLLNKSYSDSTHVMKVSLSWQEQTFIMTVWTQNMLKQTQTSLSHALHTLQIIVQPSDITLGMMDGVYLVVSIKPEELNSFRKATSSF